MKPMFRSSGDSSITIIDPIQRRQYPLQLSMSPRLEPADTDQFYFPVDNAVTLTTENIVLPYVVGIHVRNLDGETVVRAEEFAYEELPEQEYFIELDGRIRVYLRVSSDLTVASSRERMELDFGTPTRVHVGARSYHDRPGTTITTTTELPDIMKSISTFGSALKTTSCERSLPSLRGHPPQIELGNELQIPAELSPPESGVTIEIPPKIEMIYPVSTLVYYLGANLVPGNRPRLITDRGFCHAFNRSLQGFERNVEQVFQQVFFFDCITRTEGYYQVELNERQQIEALLDIAFDELYEKSLAEQIETYLDIPFDLIKEYLPTWPLTTYATDELDNIESLPFLVNNFSLIRMVKNREEHNATLELSEPIDEFLRGTGSKQRGEPKNAYQSYVSPPQTDSLERAWLGTGNPLGANKIIKDGFDNKLERDSSTDRITITVVCNESEMSPEYDDGDGLYGDRDELEFKIDVYRNLSVDELRTVFETKTDFLHYIGHISDDEFVCRDGGLDVGDIDDVAVDTFLLNGCRSYEQGKRLIEAGSIGGIVTYSHIGNKSATGIGQQMARLLNRGFSLRSALTLAREHHIVGNQYLVVGDGSVEIAQSENGTPMKCGIEPKYRNGTYQVTLTTYPTPEQGMGSFYKPYIDEIQPYFLTGGVLPTFTLTGDSLSQFLRLEQIPVFFENDLSWSTELDLNCL